MATPSSVECQTAIETALQSLKSEVTALAFRRFSTEEKSVTFECECQRVHHVTFSYTRNRHGGLDYREATVDGKRLYGHLVM